MAISTADFKNGMSLDLDGVLMQITDFQHVKPGKGGAFVRTTLRNVRTGAVVERTFRAGEKMERAVIDKREMQYLYNDGTDLVFMDNETYEQMNVPRDSIGTAPDFLVEGNTAVLQMYGTEIVGTELPAAVVLTVTETEPGIQGDRVSGARKPATMETGVIVQVPLFIEIGERLRIDTRSGDYIERSNG
jgi:elongation factor P